MNLYFIEDTYVTDRNMLVIEFIIQVSLLGYTLTINGLSYQDMLPHCKWMFCVCDSKSVI